MGYRFPLGWLLMALLANPLAAQTPECGEVALADCLAMPLPSQVFDAEDPALSPALPADPGQNDFDRRKTLKRLAEAGDTQAAARIELAVLAMHSGRAGVAGSELDKARAVIPPGDAVLIRRWHWLKGHVCAMDDDFDCALAEWHQASRSLPSATWLPKHYAFALWGLDRKEQAITWYSAAVRADAYLGRGNYAARSGGGKAMDAIARALFAAWSERYAPLAATILAEVDIDHEGRVERVKLLPSRLDARLLARVQAAVAGWTFTPAMQEDRAVSLSTHLYIDVRGRPAPEGGHSFEVQYAGAGPRYLDTPAPTYPQSALSRYQEGEVLVNVEVQPDGHVGEVTVASSSGHKALDQAAIHAIENWTFAVDRLDGSPVPTFVEIPVSFHLVTGAGQGGSLFNHEQRIAPRFAPTPVF